MGMKRTGGKFAQLYQWAKKKRDDRGSAIVIVIIAMAMIGILATTLLWMAYMNYMIKVADIRNKNSFYTAEEVVEQIMSGLRRESAGAVGVAYRDVLANWDNLESEAARSNLFMMTYMDTLIDKLKDSSYGAIRYDRSILEAYVDIADFSGGTSGVDVAAWNHGNALSEAEGAPEMEVVNNNSIILKNIYVSCTDADDRLSIVKTDIRLDVPKLVFENTGSIDGLYQYALIGNQGVELQGPGISQVEGSIYAGADKNGIGGLTLGLKTEADGSISKTYNTSLVLEDALRVISKGDITVEGPSSTLTVRDVAGQDNRVYAKNINLNSGTASLDSKVYVANDLTLNGVGSRVALTKEYYGYGNSAFNGLPGEPAANPVDSSAIIINGRDSTVDMSAVTRLLLAGRSYISPHLGNTAGHMGSDTVALTSPSLPVMMGESIAVKGGQVAYLVPAECIGTLKDESLIGQNPVNVKKNDIDEFKDTYGADFKEVDFDRAVYRLGGKKLRELGVGSGSHKEEDDMKHIRKVYAPYRGETLLYYYLVMDQDTAEKYFVQYYDVHANREEIDTYFNRYLSGGFQLGDFADPTTEYTILGNSLVSSALTDSGVTLLTSVDQSTLNLAGTGGTGTGTPGEGTDPAAPVDPDAYTETGENAEEVNNEPISGSVTVDALVEQIRKDYTSLTYNLKDGGAVPGFADPNLPSVYEPEKAAEYVFKSIIKCKEPGGGGTTDNVEDYLAALPGNPSHVKYETTSGQLAYLTKNDVTLSSIGGPGEVRLVISFGNVTVDQDFTGLIIAKGKIIVTGAHKIKRGGSELANVLEANSEHWKSDGTGDNQKPIDLFMNGGGSLLNGAVAPNMDAEGNLALDYSEIVRYMNWIKK